MMVTIIKGMIEYQLSTQISAPYLSMAMPMNSQMGILMPINYKALLSITLKI